MIRLQKILSQSGVASRRAAEQLMLQGRVEVNGRIVTELGTKADPAADDIRVDGRRIRTEVPRRYLLMYKPRGIVSTRSDPQRRRTVIDVLAEHGLEGYYYPVGRLDADSEGLLLLTNDGAFAERVMHPRFKLERRYEVQVVGVPDERDLLRLRKGVDIDGTRTRPAKVRIVRHARRKGDAQAVLEITIHEGRNRQVRRMCDAVGYRVRRLHRSAYAGLGVAGLKPGEWRELSSDELALIRRTSAPPG